MTEPVPLVLSNVDRPFVRVLRGFDRATDRVVREVALVHVTEEELHVWFDVPPDNPMVDCWPVTEAQRRKLEERVRVDLDPVHLQWFLEADAVDSAPEHTEEI
jgi:hypothetical protein